MPNVVTLFQLHTFLYFLFSFTFSFPHVSDFPLWVQENNHFPWFSTFSNSSWAHVFLSAAHLPHPTFACCKNTEQLALVPPFGDYMERCYPTAFTFLMCKIHGHGGTHEGENRKRLAEAALHPLHFIALRCTSNMVIINDLWKSARSESLAFWRLHVLCFVLLQKKILHNVCRHNVIELLWGTTDSLVATNRKKTWGKVAKKFQWQ